MVLAEIIIKILARMTILLIVALFYLRELSQCAAPLHVWVIGEWLGLVSTCLMLSDTIRQAVGEFTGLSIFVSFCVWTSTGLFMYIMSVVKTPDCIPNTLKVDLVLFMSVVMVALFVLLWTMIMQGIKVFNRLFYNKRKTMSIISEIKSGMINVEQYIKANPNLDGYALFDEEKDVIKEICAVDAAQLEKMFAG